MVKVNTKVGNVLRQMLNSRLFDAADFKQTGVIVWYLRSVKEEETANWIETHPHEYIIGLLEGFEIDNSQNAQLRDIHS